MGGEAGFGGPLVVVGGEVGEEGDGGFEEGVGLRQAVVEQRHLAAVQRQAQAAERVCGQGGGEGW